MIQIIGPQLSQWDTGRRISVSGSNATHAHFANRGDSHAVIMELENGEAKIPDYLLQTGKDLYIYLVLDGITQESKTFSLRKRERPENYVYEDDRRNYIYELITDARTAAEAAGQAAEAANQAAGTANNAAQNATKAATSANDAAGNANMAVNNANEAAKNANEAATKAAHTAKSLMVIGGADGTVINLDNAADQVLVGLRVFGKTTQDGTPTPDAPVELVSLGNSGSITVNVAGASNAQSMTIATPHGLPGVPIAAGGNYIDAEGTRWLSCEKDLQRGVDVSWVVPVTLDGSADEQWINGYIPDGVNNRFECKFASIFGVNAKGVPGNITVGLPCNQFKYEMVSTIPSVNSCRAVYNPTEHSYYILFNPSVEIVPLGDVAAWRTFLASSPITVLLPVLNPLETPLSEEELAAYAALHTYRDNTTVTNDAGAYMELEYVMDAKKYIDNKIAGAILAATVE